MEMARKANQELNRILVDDINKLDATLNSARRKDGKLELIGQDNKALWDLILFMTTVLSEKTPAFKIILRAHEKIAIPASSLANYFGIIGSFRELYSSDLSYAPHLQLFFDCYREYPFCSCMWKNKNRLIPDGRTEAEVFDNFIESLRRKGNSINVRRKIADWERNTTENLKRVDSYVNALFDRYARLLVLRVDFLYRIATLSEMEIRQARNKLLELSSMDQMRFFGDQEGEEELTRRETLARVDVKEAMKDRDHLFANMRSKPSLFKHMVGFVWSLEWSRVSGYHLHCAFFLDGSKVQKHEYLAEQIGQYWEAVITEGRGIYHNCNRDKENYGDLWAIGPVDHHDEVKRGHLMRTLGYLAKKDQYVHVKPSAKCKRFGTGRMPQPKSGAGRPRKT